MVVQTAKSQNVLCGGTEDFLVAREFGRMAGYDQQLARLECLFIVSAIDHTITLAGDPEIAKVALELKIEHADVVRARLARREYLIVLRRPAEGRPVVGATRRRRLRGGPPGELPVPDGVDRVDEHDDVEREVVAHQRQGAEFHREDHR
ncbi:MAG: hypothetical protein MUE61_04040, partial [Vicinamibacterales bacterium]|nr:hypothetical protein [Vicinamibacterales bacterium]